MRTNSLATSRAKTQSVGNPQTPRSPPLVPNFTCPPTSPLHPALALAMVGPSIDCSDLPALCGFHRQAPRHSPSPHPTTVCNHSQRTRGGGSQNEPHLPKKNWGETEGGWFPGRPWFPQRLTLHSPLRLQSLRGRSGGVSSLHPLLRHLRQQGSPPCCCIGSPSLPSAALQPPLPESMGDLLPHYTTVYWIKCS